MKINQIIVMKETREGEGRIALTPDAVNILRSKFSKVLVESSAGSFAGFHDSDFESAGAEIFHFGRQRIPEKSLILRVKRPIPTREAEENLLFDANSTMIGFLDPFDVAHEDHLTRWHQLGLRIFCLELFAFSRDDPRNAQAAMSRFAGKLALNHALQRYQGELPKRVTIFGTGPAAISAAQTAKRLDLPIQCIGRSEAHRQKIESAHISYHVLPEQDPDKFIRELLHQETIIITAARVPGQKAPLLINEKTLNNLPDDCILIDLSRGEGGSVFGSQEDKVVIHDRGIQIINVSGYPKAAPKEASEVFADCMVHLVTDLFVNQDPSSVLSFYKEI